MSSRFRLLSLGLAAVVLAGGLFGCDLLGVSDAVETEPSFPEGTVLAASMAGDQPGLWLFDPESLERTDVVESVAGHSPTGMAFSPGGQRLYLTWIEDLEEMPKGRRALVRLDTRSWEITKRRTLPDSSLGSASLIYDSTRAQIIAYGRNDGVVEFYDAQTLERHRTESLGNSQEIDVAVLAPDRDVVYFESHSDAGHHVQVYDLDTGTIVRRLHLTDDPTLQKSALSDLALSPEERFLYATTYLSPGGPGRFFVVNLETGEAVFEGPAGGYSNLAVHPGGRYVYVDCPAGGWRVLVPTRRILRFDRKAREMEVFIGPGWELELRHAALVADEITMLPGGDAFVIRNPHPARSPRKEGKPKSPSLLQVSTETGNVHATYVHSRRDEKGHVPAFVIGLRSGVVPE